MLRKYAIGQAQFDESKVRRDEDGRFASKGSGGAPSFQQRQLVEASPGRLFEEKWRPRGAGLFQQGKSSVPGREHRVVTSWERLGTKNAELPPEYTGSKQRELPVDGYLAHEMTWQQPKAYTRKQHDAIRGALVSQIVENRQGAIERATENGLIPEGTSKKLINRAYNLASMRALHEFGVGRFDYKMTDQLKEEMRPLTPAMRYFQRRIGNAMRSDPRTKGLWEPYREEFGVPNKQGKLWTNREGKGNQVRLVWAKSQGPHTEFIKADMPGGPSAGRRGVLGGVGGLLASSFLFAGRRKAKAASPSPKRSSPPKATREPNPNWSRRRLMLGWNPDVAKAHLPDMLIKRKAGTPLSDAERQQRSAAAKARWQRVVRVPDRGAITPRDAVRLMRQLGRTEKVERALFTSPDFRRVYGRAKGTEDSVGPTPSTFSRVKDGYVVLHNHPESAPLSPLDLRALYHSEKVRDQFQSFGGTSPEQSKFVRQYGKNASAVLAADPKGNVSVLRLKASPAEIKAPASRVEQVMMILKNRAMNRVGPSGPWRDAVMRQARMYDGTLRSFARGGLVDYRTTADFGAPARRAGEKIARLAAKATAEDVARWTIKGVRAFRGVPLGFVAGMIREDGLFKAEPMGALAKSDAVHPGARRTLDLADKIMAAHDAQPARRRATAAEMAPPEVRATLPLARRILREHAGEQAALVQAPGRTRHRAGERVIRDPRRSLSDLLG